MCQVKRGDMTKQDAARYSDTPDSVSYTQILYACWTLYRLQCFGPSVIVFLIPVVLMPRMPYVAQVFSCYCCMHLPQSFFATLHVLCPVC